MKHLTTQRQNLIDQIYQSHDTNLFRAEQSVAQEQE